MTAPDRLLHDLPASAADLPPPPRFTFPFHYRPHPLALAAAGDLQQQLSAQTDWVHDFGIDDPGVGARGKMFGVLVVSITGGRLAYLAAHSGKVADSNHLPGFVPPVFDLLDAEGFYRKGELAIDALTKQYQIKKTSDEYLSAVQTLDLARTERRDRLAAERAVVKTGKKQRKQLREAALLTDGGVTQELEKRLSAESIRESYALKDLSRALRKRESLAQAAYDAQAAELQALLELRSSRSRALQQKIFAHYNFLDAAGNRRDLNSIFEETVFGVPPAGAGECAAPKLLQYAYLNGLTPVCLAEFWWGQAPDSEIRKHGHYYPACRGKCEPILGHMLRGLEVDPNPLLVNPAADKVLTTVYEDDTILVVDKPPELLSVPGKHISDSVYTRIQQRYPEASGPLIVHRLDMSTSGLLLLTKTKEAHKLLQRQFFKRSVKKRYVAVVSGRLTEAEGTIDLPLRGDLHDRPRQIVCHQHGKTARTHWRRVDGNATHTLVHLWPVTGRTHQLRVHTAHPGGLNAPIVGDDLYGQAAERLYLHAEELTFRHPVDRVEMTFTAPAGFQLSDR